MCAVSTDAIHVLCVCCIYKCLSFTLCVCRCPTFIASVYRCLHVLSVCCVCRCHTFNVCVLHSQIPYMCCLCAVSTDSYMCCMCAVFTDALHVLSVCCVYRCLHVLSVCCVYRCLHVLCLQISYVCFLAAYTYMLLVDFQRYPSPLELFLMLWIFSFLVGEIHTVSTLSCIFSFLLGEIHPVNVLCTASSPFSLEKFTL